MGADTQKRLQVLKAEIAALKRTWVFKNIQPDAIQALCSLASVVDTLVQIVAYELKPKQLELLDPDKKILEEFEQQQERVAGQYNAGSGV